jgi:hypothetical protein
MSSPLSKELRQKDNIRSMPIQKDAKAEHHQWHVSESHIFGRLRSGGSWFKANPGKRFTRPYRKNNEHKNRGWRGDSSDRGLPSKHEALSSNPNP